MSLLVHKLHAGYGHLRVLQDISFATGPDQLLVFLGPNGAGKSTLLSAIAGLVVGEGRVEVNGEEFGDEPAYSRARRGIALVPEGRRNLFASMSVRDNLELALSLCTLGRRKMRHDMIHDLFPILSERRDQAAGMLSGGEQQMLAIAVALAHEPRLLMLDEPTQGLAPVVLEGLAQSIRALRPLGLTVVLAEQNISFARSVADRYHVLRQGQLGEAGPIEELDDLARVSEMLV